MQGETKEKLKAFKYIFVSLRNLICIINFLIGCNILFFNSALKQKTEQVCGFFNFDSNEGGILSLRT